MRWKERIGEVERADGEVHSRELAMERRIAELEEASCSVVMGAD